MAWAASGSAERDPDYPGRLVWTRPKRDRGERRIVADKGLREVIAADTKISDIDGEKGTLSYVGYEIADLAEHSTFEEVVYLLHHLELPTAPELERTATSLANERDLHPFQVQLMRTLAEQTSPMSMLRTSVSAASAFDPDGWDESPDAQARKALRLIAKTASLIATYHRLRTGMEMVTPNPALPHAADFLWMLHGTDPDPEDARVLDVLFVLYADHTMNASTFTARIVASTLADMFSAITAAIGTLKGPLHGGANEEAMKSFEEVGKPKNAEAYVRDRLERHEKIFGFGHAVYKTYDPRAKILKRLSKEACERAGQTQLHEIAEAIEKASFEQKGLYPNVDFYAAAVFHVLGIPTDLMTPVFAAARMAGWTAHVREQYADNKVIRPGSRYVGPKDQEWVPLEKRGEA
jgi:citrate synthase